HAIAVALGFAGAWAFSACFPKITGIRRRDSALALLVFSGSTYFSLVVVNVLLTGDLVSHPLFFVGGFYQRVFFKPSAAPYWLDLIRVGTGGAVALAIFIGLPLVYACLYVRQTFRSESAKEIESRDWKLYPFV